MKLSKCKLMQSTARAIERLVDMKRRENSQFAVVEEFVKRPKKAKKKGRANSSRKRDGGSGSNGTFNKLPSV
jgi:hypothetical protein